MEPKMSVGLDTSISIGLSGHPWAGPSPSPTLKLQTPTIEGLPVDTPNLLHNPLSAHPHTTLPDVSNPLNISTGLTPRFSPGSFPLASPSPGVSGEIANVQDAAPSQSLSDLFRCSEYPFTSTAVPTSATPVASISTPKPPTAPHTTSATTPGRPPTARPFSRPPHPPTPNPAHPAASAALQSSASAQHHVAVPGSNPILQPPASSTPSYVSTFPSTSSAPAHQSALPQTQAGHPQQHNMQYSQLAGQPPLSTAAHVMSSAHPAPPYSYPIPQRTDHLNALPPRPIPPTGVAPSVVPALANAQPIAPVADQNPAAPASVGGHRSVLGSGIVSSAVQEAQVKARMKAETFAKSRKRKRTEDVVVEEKAEKSTDEDSKLSPEQLKQKRYQRRLALNRESAAVSRVRRREYVKLLEEQLVSAERERVKLATELSNMQRQHSKLRNHLEKLEGKIDDSPDS